MEQKLKQLVGDLVIQVLSLQHQVEELKKQLEDKTDAPSI